MANFQDLLNKKAADVKPPKPLPVGTYLCIVDGQPEKAVIGKNNTDCLNFTLKPIQAADDVDQVALQENLEGHALSDRKIRHRLFLTDDSLWRLTKFLVDDLGIEEGNKSVGQMVPEAMGRQVYVNLGHRIVEENGQAVIFGEVKGTARV